MTIKIKHKRGTASNITSANPTLAAGELAFETDTRRFKVGDGTTAWSSLSYVTPYVTATDRILGRSSAGAGSAEEITCTAFGRSLIDDADAAAARTTLAAAEVNHTHSASDVYVPDNYANFGGADLESVLETIDGALFSGAPTVSPAFTGAATFDNTGNVVPLTVTNTGTANSFVVNDASGDSSPFVIDASGNVGVGTSSPAAALDVGSGNLRFSSTAQRITGDFSNSTISNRLMFQTSTSNGNTSVRCIPNGTATVSNFVAHNGSDSNNTSFIALQASLTETIVNSGATGTGTYLPLTFYTNNAPQVQISTSGQLLVTAGSGSSGSYKPGIAVSGDDDTGLQQVGGANTISLVTAGSERVRLDASGNVGIGLSPLQPLHVGRSGTGIVGRFTDNATQTLDIGITASAGVYLDNPNSGYVDFQIGGVSGMRLTGGSELLIGTTTDNGAYKLQVNSQIYATNATVATSDARFKTNVKALTDATAVIEALRPVAFDFIPHAERNFATERQVGLIAQEAQSALAGTDYAGSVVAQCGDHLGLAYEKLVPVLIKALQESNARIAALEERLNHA